MLREANIKLVLEFLVFCLCVNSFITLWEL